MIVSSSYHLVEELAQGLVALPLVADLGGRHAAGAGADVGGTVLLTRVVQVAGLGGVQAVVLPGHRRLSCRGGERAGRGQDGVRTGWL